MEIINSYKEESSEVSYNLLYLAKPIYGGWVTFTAHLSQINNYPIYKITKKSEKTQRDYGYDCNYQNLCFSDILKLDNILITAIDKHFWEYLRFLVCVAMSSFVASLQLIGICFTEGEVSTYWN